MNTIVLLNIEAISLLDYVLLPFFLVSIYLIAFKIRDRQYPPGHKWRPYFIPGLTAKICGAIGIGLVYQYYYGGIGDTMLYYKHEMVINSAFDESIDKWFNLIFHVPDWYDANYYDKYISKMEWYQAPTEYTVCAIIAFLGIFTFTTYLPTSLLLGTIAYTGVWALFRTFATKYPQYTKQVAISVLFIPSTIMWGSGIFKDTVCMFGLGWLTYGAFRLLINRDFSIGTITLFVLSIYFVGSIKVYILLAFLPALLLWILFSYSYRIRNGIVRFMLSVAVIGGVFAGFIAVSSQLDTLLGKYSLENIQKTSEVTSTFIKSISGDQGSGYDLGPIDLTPAGMLKKFPKAVNVSLFRPYIWETRKPIQMLNAIEAFMFMWITIKVLLTIGPRRTWGTIKSDPTIQFCLIFAIIFAFSVGISSGNFGALSRYRIPCLPFYAMAMMFIYYKHNPQSKNILSLRLRG